MHGKVLSHASPFPIAWHHYSFRFLENLEAERWPPTATGTTRALRAFATAHNGHLLAKLDGPQFQNPGA